MLKRILLCGLLSVLWSAPAIAQDLHPYELFTGYGYVRPSGGQANLNGFDLSFTANLNSWLGFTVGLGGQYGDQVLTTTTPSGTAAVKTNARFNSLGFGPRFTYRGNDRLTPFAHVLVGLARGEWTGPASVSGGETSFATAVGGGIDAAITDHFGIRLIQAELVRTYFGPTHENLFRLAAGARFSF